MQESVRVAFAVLYAIFRIGVVKEKLRRSRLLIVAELGRWLLELFEWLLTLIGLKL